MNKTAVSILTELGRSINVSPVYELIDNEHRLPNMGFNYQVTFLFWQVVGSGMTKKDAKQAASQQVLDKIRSKNIIFSSYCCPFLSENESEIHRLGTGGKTEINDKLLNPIGYLQELCTQKKMKFPKYELVNINGPAHAKEFTVQCSVAGFKEQATATCKKWAKHYAAREMITRLREQGDLNDSGFKENPETCDNISAKNSAGMESTEEPQSFSEVERSFVLEELVDILADIKEYKENNCQKPDDGIENIFYEILSGMEAKSKIFLGIIGDMYIITMYISTTPHIVVADAGKNPQILFMNIYQKVVETLIKNLSRVS